MAFTLEVLYSLDKLIGAQSREYHFLHLRYVLREDHPFCIKCYENVFANNCDECGKVIGIDSKVNFEKEDEGQYSYIFNLPGSII